ncbi:hypothetical protein JRI60_49020 [Archangium violaceum]|uniref:hypothetical protein n=1 Tax=Archangium violaceum TaxID=83451 RepID=UPI00194F4F32|nr:hypothetical protein [Archangium violaceum]QRN96840.1 hypothetical protein JRI60_49020 [Archangium violaceum]
MATPLENTIQEWFEQLVKDERLRDTIVGLEKLKGLFTPEYEERHIPALVLDHLLRRKSVLAARAVLEALPAARLLVTNQSVSLDSHRLRPDLVLASEDAGELLLVELKRSDQTEREAITELLGYEQELKNHLPFLSDLDLSFIIVSTEFSALLDHSISQMIAWEHRRILCLRLDTSGQDWKLHLHLPTAWTDLQWPNLPEDALLTVTLALYVYESDEKAEDVGRHVPTALQLIARDGDIHRSSGFTLAWRSTSSGLPSRWCITICVLNPWTFLPAREGATLEVRRGPLLEHLTRLVDEGAHPTSLYTVAKRAQRFLSRFCTADFEGVMTWDQTVANIETNSFPVEMEFWGVLGEHVREFVTNPLVREQVLPYTDTTGMDWRAPEIGLPLVRYLSGRALFAHGHFTAEAIFEFGILIGRATLLCLNLDSQEEKVKELLAGQLAWLEADLLSALQDIVARYMVAEDLQTKPPPLKLPLSANPARSAESLTGFIAWFANVFLEHNEPHRMFFSNAQRLAGLMNKSFSQWLSGEQLAGLEQEARAFVINVLSTPEDQRDAIALLPPDIQGFARMSAAELEAAVGQLKTQALRDLVARLPKALGELIGPVFHQIPRVSPGPFDVDWVKSQIEAQVAAGNTSVALIFAPDGSIQIGNLPIQFTAAHYVGRAPVVDNLSVASVMEWKTSDELRQFLPAPGDESDTDE